jgi:hypothetical protein
MGEIKRSDIPVIATEFQIANKAGITRTKRKGTVVREIAVATYDVSGGVHAGAAASYGLGVYIPAKAIITKVWTDVVTTFTDGDDDSATIALTLQSAGDILAATAVSAAGDIWDAGIHGSKIGYPNFGADAAHDSAAEVAALFAASMLKLTAVREITATVAVEYVLSD